MPSCKQHSRYSGSNIHKVNLIKIVRGQTQNQRISKRSILPLWGILCFHFGTADQKHLNEIKKNVEIIYKNQIKQGKVLDDIISITNISRAMIIENRLMINNMIDSIQFLNETLVNIHKEVEPLFITRRFLLTHAEVLIHTHRLSIAVSEVSNSINKLGQYLDTLSYGKLSPTLVDPIHLSNELLRIQKEFPPTTHLPQSPADNVWHL